MYLFFNFIFILHTLINKVNKVNLDKQKGAETTVHASCSSSF